MFDPDEFDKRIGRFPKGYSDDFYYFWRWKLKVEGNGGHILDEQHRKSAHRRLSEVMGKWQTYRVKGVKGIWRERLGEALANIADAYDAIRSQSLLSVNKVEALTLHQIWDELGRVKEPDGQVTRGSEYYVIAVCKPLMLLWGQTLAFDSNVRKNVPFHLGILRQPRWRFERWMRVLKQFQIRLQQNPAFIAHLEQTALKGFGNSEPTPFGRFLDMYYFAA